MNRYLKPQHIELYYRRLSPECCVAIANALSHDIDEYMDNGSRSVTQLDHDEIVADLNGMFDATCAAVEWHGLVTADHVACPKS